MSMEHSVDPAILKKLSASVTHSHGSRKNLSYIISVEALAQSQSQTRNARHSSQCVARSFDEFRRFRKILLARVGVAANATSFLTGGLKAYRCPCRGAKGCAFDVTRTYLERTQFTRMPLFGLGLTEADLNNRQVEMNNFLRMLFGIIHRMQPSEWNANCLFLHDILDFLDVEHAFLELIEELMREKKRHLTLGGWKAFTLETYGLGIRTQTA
ncbi:hypothetical protein Poli38472_005806 [Pythium oligandrum]|uniref:PX domain-containing protein n=1 Tax=Pythium oligandrum TaxID=41045 RepID=A0A8K1FS94_PYTOL|nr:hypothetical protein Poli38472_005806 [Pythium oligandrum]|eukprot:TMW68338.1 hypothetical protein Poli38472_005806 [Pythium oligandrum]